MEILPGLKDLGVEISWEVQKRWLQAYGPDATWIVKELFKAMAWMAANPKRKKKNVVRYLNNWLARAKEYSVDTEKVKEVGTTLYHKKFVAPTEECEKCHGDAYMQAKNKATRAIEWVRCPCVAGQNVSSTLPFFNSTTWELL